MLEKIKKEIAEISEKIMKNNIASTKIMSEKLSSGRLWEIIGKLSNNFPEQAKKNN